MRERAPEPREPVPHQTLIHLYRGELGRSDRWRQRLDTTTNWAVTTTAGVMSVSFAATASRHVVLLFGLLGVLSFLLIESRRYRYYDLWIRRVRLLEAGYFAPTLREETPDWDTLRELAAALASPHLAINFLDALALRLRHNYAPMVILLLVGWPAKLVVHPEMARSAAEAIARAHVGPVPPGAVVAFYLCLLVLFVGLFAWGLLEKLPRGELRPRPPRWRPLAYAFRRRR